MLDRASDEGRPLSPMKLLKLVYIAYGWSLAILDKKLFEEPIYAWDHGPVVRSLYHEFKHFGRHPIQEPSIDLDLDHERFVVPRIPEDDERANVVLNKVWDVYKNFSAWDLRNKTHEPDSPWTRVYKEDQRDTVIPDDLIASHFRQKISQYLDNARKSTAA